jgi:hypothetical protein
MSVFNGRAWSLMGRWWKIKVWASTAAPPPTAETVGRMSDERCLSRAGTSNASEVAARHGADRLMTGTEGPPVRYTAPMVFGGSSLHALRDHGARLVFGIPGDVALLYLRVVEDSGFLPPGKKELTS